MRIRNRTSAGDIRRIASTVRSRYAAQRSRPVAPAKAKLRSDIAREAARCRNHARFNFHFLRLAVHLLNDAVNLRQNGRNVGYDQRIGALIGHHVAALAEEFLDRRQLRREIPYLDYDNARFPVQGALVQRRGGTVRHDAVAWGYARAADRRGVDIIENCEVTGIVQENGVVTGVETTRGRIGAGKVGIAVAGSSSLLANMAGFRLPIESHALQAFVTEGLKPLIDNVITFGAGHFYISQSDKGGLVFGGDIDGYNSYAARGNLPTVEDVCEGGVALMPMIGRARLLRSWGGIMDMTMDGSPIIDFAPVKNLVLNAGWCYGGFKAVPAMGYCFAHLIAREAPHEVAAAYRLDRFAEGKLIDEKGVGAQPNLH